LSIFRDYLVKPHHTGAGLGSCKLSLALLLLLLLLLLYLHHLLILPVDKRGDRLAVKHVVRLVISSIIQRIARLLVSCVTRTTVRLVK
jgi:hypothetical protein